MKYNLDGNLAALRQFENDEANAAAREEYIELKKDEVQEELLSVGQRYEKAFVNDSKGNKIELSDFIADMEIDAGVFAEFIKECYIGQGSYFRNKMLKQLDKYCEDLAIELVDNEEPPECDYDTREEYEGDM